MKTKLRRKVRRKRQQLSPEARKRRREERRFKSDIRTLFTNAGFQHIPTREVNIDVAGRTGDLDSVFVFENIIVITEDTTAAAASVPDHLRKKAEYFSHLSANQEEFLDVLAATFPKWKVYRDRSYPYDWREFQLRFVYCTRFGVDESYRGRYASACTLLTYSSLQYFLSLTRTIRKSARFELFKFLEVELDTIGPGKSATEASSYQALLLPEIPSGFPEGHKLVSFLVDPETLLERAYVLRADSWLDQESLYQRLLIRGKITSMRDYLVTEGRVFVNNIIVTLPADTILESPTGDRPRGSQAAEITAVRLTIPRRFSAIGIIDGQHRVFAYHEGEDRLDKRIAALRKRQHLLVTGIIYPQSVTRNRAQVFEARLFLEINDKQKRVRGDLKQSIERIVNPYSGIAIAKAVIERLTATGPLSGMLGVHFFDTGKLKTASIVSYGLRHIVAIEGEVSLFAKWPGPGKTGVKNGRDKAGLEKYVAYCATQLNLLASGFKHALPADLWTTDLKRSRALTTTTINGLVFCMRQLIENDKLGEDFDYYSQRFARMSVDFRPGRFPYRSSHWRELGRQLYAQCFA